MCVWWRLTVTCRCLFWVTGYDCLYYVLFVHTGQQIPYSEIRDLIVQYNAIVRWDSFQLSPYFDHQVNGKDYQVSHMTFSSVTWLKYTVDYCWLMYYIIKLFSYSSLTLRPLLVYTVHVLLFSSCVLEDLVNNNVMLLLSLSFLIIDKLRPLKLTCTIVLSSK